MKLLMTRVASPPCALIASTMSLVPPPPAFETLLKILLNKPRTEVNVQLHERAVADVLEAVDLARLDHEDVADARFECLTIDGVAASRRAAGPADVRDA